ncbi:MAG: reverse transcriptase domain-containing protein [Candidatus Humimicrobiaceae bacterium]
MFKNLTELSEAIGINFSYLRNIIRYSEKFYNTYYLKQSSCKTRIIDSPNFEMKALQRWILENILKKISISDRANGFVKGKSIKTNASFHINKKFILVIDIRDFFHSIKSDKVYNLFLKVTKDEKLASYLTILCTYRGYLPQGAVTSPMLSNIIFRPIDNKFKILCNNLDINYSRYADDLCFSSNSDTKINNLKPEIEKILEGNGFFINTKKQDL